MAEEEETDERVDQVERAKRLRDQIQEMRKSSAEANPPVQPESPRAFVERKMREGSDEVTSDDDSSSGD
jgi:hypothetical protein